MTQYELLKSTQTLCRVLERNNIDLRDARFVQMYEDYVRMKNEGHKYIYIMYYLTEQYDVSETTAYRILKRMAKEIDL